ncbi:MAG TPA: type II toxin-antitoxin system Phd/YefM family antitoxin [Rhodoferax sp.]|nr:type II toxin-antitoxin system Phd/YefM family antitoxin [Rhodoferax sp.]
MQAWSVQDAKAKFSEFLDACLAEGPQMVTKRGAAVAVSRAAFPEATLAVQRGPYRTGHSSARQGTAPQS